jgi:beta-N-acetylhexosaminidase
MIHVQSGLEVLLESRLDLLAGRRAGLIASVSSVDRALVSTVERLHRCPEVRLAALFGPEHGLRGEAQAGEHVGGTTDALTGLPVYSLYGAMQKPTPEMLAGLDVLVIDLQDGGVRFYTFLYTMAYAMQAAAESGLPVIVLDRPAPINAVTVEGPVLEPAYASFVGLYPIPLRYGMTVGELAGLFNHAFNINCDLTVVPLAGWRRELWFDQTDLPFVPPSPNLPTLAALTVYPGTCLVEGTNLSEGRGTTMPFQYIGAPWVAAEGLAAALNGLELPGVRFRPVYFTPTFSKHQGAQCGGVHLYVTDRTAFRPVETTLHLLATVKRLYPEDFAWLDPWTPGGHRSIDLLSGSSAIREGLDAGTPVDDLAAAWQDDLRAFERVRAEYLLYPA